MNPMPSTQQNAIIEAFNGGGIGMYPIAILLVLVGLIIIHNFVRLKDLAVDKVDFTDKLFAMILRGDVRQAVTFCDSKPTPLSNTLKAGLTQVLNRRPDEEVQVAMDAAALKENQKVEGWTPFLSVFGNVATLLGLLGTIAGMIKSFKGVAEADAATKSAELSRGIAEAMNCTAFGLIVAIPAILAFGYYQRRQSNILNDMTESSMSLMNLVVSNREKIKD